MNVITAEGLVKVYRSRKNEVRALDGLDLDVAEGTVLGLLGPNGAGKTTAVRVLTTLLKPDSGRASVAGFDVVREAQRVRSLIGLDLNSIDARCPPGDDLGPRPAHPVRRPVDALDWRTRGSDVRHDLGRLETPRRRSPSENALDPVESSDLVGGNQCT